MTRSFRYAEFEVMVTHPRRDVLRGVVDVKLKHKWEMKAFL